MVDVGDGDFNPDGSIVVLDDVSRREIPPSETTKYVCYNKHRVIKDKQGKCPVCGRDLQEENINF
ncbi:MAG: heavy metal-binding domain-containing protein [bacterium]